MNKKIRWGILGAGRIAQKFASDLKLVDDTELFAIASRGGDYAAVLGEAGLAAADIETLVSGGAVVTG